MAAQRGACPEARAPVLRLGPQRLVTRARWQSQNDRAGAPDLRLSGDFEAAPACLENRFGPERSDEGSNPSPSARAPAPRPAGGPPAVGLPPGPEGGQKGVEVAEKNEEQEAEGSQSTQPAKDRNGSPETTSSRKGGTVGKGAAATGVAAKGRRGRRGRGDEDGASPRSGRRGGLRGVLSVLATIIAVAVALIAVVIVLGILLKVLEANRENSIVEAVIGIGQSLVGPIGSIFSLSSRNLEVAVNWGLAAVLYLVVGNLVAGLLRRG